MITAAVVVVVGVEQGIILAMVLSIIDHLRRGYHPRDTIVVRNDAGGFRSIPVAEAPPNEDIQPGLVVYRFAASLYYANANKFGEEVHAILARPQGAPTWFCIDAAAIGDVDYSAGETIIGLHAQMQEHGTRLVFADVDDDVRAELEFASGSQNWSVRTRTSIAWWRPPRRSTPPRAKGPAMAKVIKHRSVEERKAQGKASREQTQLASHTGWEPAADRPDPVALLEEQNTTREPDLVPVRHGRMMVLAVHVLPGRGEDHGRRPEGHADGRV